MSAEQNDWREYLTSAEAAELEEIERAVDRMEDDRRKATDRRRRLYDRARKRMNLARAA